MKKLMLIVLLVSLSSGCTTIRVQPVSSDLELTDICIEENPKVIVGDFLSVIRNRFEYHGINTQIFSSPDPKECEYILTYTALKTWDVGTYLHHAELRLERNGRKIALAEYHLNGKGGLSPMKWQGTKTKMDPVVDELLGEK